MTTERVVDDEGRVQVPPEMLEALALEPGDPVTVEEVDGEVVVRPDPTNARVHDLQRRGRASPVRVDTSTSDRPADE